MAVQARVVQGRWLALLAAMRAVEHLILGGVFAAIVMDRLLGVGISIEPVVRAIFGMVSP